ncbi:undecaprenyl-phosphate alpha-N-acetylglucosaminyl 1-phosphate transferase [Photobacterium kishitanii]|uniref:UDP-N-acetylglucosamine--undecaprenyl-phosphate N-acetylglucosaminephosphotransferase n=1 Tax=Photobacterium kishitanii TaxID=318456 RepID=UPI000D15E798|nr:UDP-N-acetylglucosamine--undecaprenyl-phosphate N-acetylglucosaminephosphotransferase [Photobacterium kishitanii]PSW62335.1 undecaprenyl-phosphate alpha-N-acetylglucosaminyl 1-phosphate transferase [Photobacterium kishitanii]
MDNAYLFVFFASFSSLFVMRKIAKVIGLVDRPDVRKLHQGMIPLVGGISIYIALIMVVVLYLPMNLNLQLYLSCSTLLILLGVLDDYFNISVKIRLLTQTGISLAMILIGDLKLINLGYLFGNETIILSESIGIIITIMAVIGAINAFNMVDGIDGLVGGLASVAFCSLGFVFLLSGDEFLATLCLLIVIALIPYIMLNLGFPFGYRFKVFMGDAGSMFIGFSIIWMLLSGTQNIETKALKPVTALWIIAIPLMDMATIMIRRIIKGHSPFKPDREHLHHICQRMGLSSTMTLIVICFIGTICSILGVWADLNNIPESTMFISFLVLFIFYFTTSFVFSRLQNCSINNFFARKKKKIVS